MRWGTAMCPRYSCGAPLIGTMHVPKAEFYCLDCGSSCGFLSPKGDKSPEAEARQAEYQAEWDQHVKGKVITPRAWHKSCPVCYAGEHFHGNPTHDLHATDEEWAADGAARAWLRNRLESAA